MSYLSVSTWSLHRLLGPLRWTVWNEETGEHSTNEQAQPEILSLLELPEEAGRRGYRAVEVCHFHFPSTAPDYLEQLKQSFLSAGVSFDTLLLDYGNLTADDSKRREADLELSCRWIDTAALAGAKQIRIIAGEAGPQDEEALRLSAAALRELAAYAEDKGVRVVSENFKSLTSTGDSCKQLLELTGDAIGFITDFGNFKAPHKYAEFEQILPASVSVHAKADYDEQGLPDEAELRLCLERVRTSGFDGAMVLIYDGPGGMWEGLERVKRIVEPYL
ncbi:sugar phosphate isomerase/epimerase family protein [Paenibacillus nasutitermitis]|uniref:Xylose isomerase n=1 Tax=Paenibacillus nasutitermitis TaxID=1652958 RepID=A0A916YX68_9BACL|nr:TIM barrel protein [Paenibacillus nasutitermitis]GGD65841.1 xylose isomerase [Paenibacillus nasutitermitis]